MKKSIKVRLSPAGIDRAIREIEEYKIDFLKKTEIFRKRVAEKMTAYAQTLFDAAEEDIVLGSDSFERVEVKCEHGEGISLVIAKGEDAVFIEFGTGVFHNGAAGTSLHPKGQELGFTIGSYGKGKGRQPAWGYYKDGEVVVTRGVEAQMPLYETAKQAAKIAAETAREVFG